MDAERRKYLEMQLSAYLDGELTPQELAEVEAWLAAEPEARRLLAHLRVTAESVQSLPRARASEELLGNLRNRLERQALLEMTKPAEVVTRTPVLSWGKWVAAAAVIGLTFVAGYFTWTLRSGQQVSGPQYALQDANKSPGKLTYSAEGGEDTRWRRSSPESEASRKPAAVAPSASPPPPAVPAAKPAGSVGEKFALAERSTPAKPSEQLLLPSAEGEKDTSFGATVVLDEKTVEETDRAEGAAKRLLAGGGGFGALGAMAAGDTDQTVVYDLGKVVAGPVPVDGRTRVMTFAFADADSRAKAIESLQREVLMDGADEQANAARRQFARSRSSKTAAQPQAAPPSASVAARPGSAAESSSPAGSLSKTKEVQYGFEVGGSNAVDKLGDEALLSAHGRIAAVETDRASRVNVLRIDTADDATAERLMVVLGGEAKQSAARIHSMTTAVADSSRLKKRESGQQGGSQEMESPTGQAVKGVRADGDGDRIRDNADFGGGMGFLSTLSEPVAPQKPPGGFADTMPSAVGGAITWDVPWFTEADSGRGWADDRIGVANGVLDLKLNRDAAGDYYGDFSGVPATSPARSPQTRGDYYDGYGWFKGDMAGAGMAGLGGMYGAMHGTGVTTAPAASPASRPASHPGGQQADANLLVVYFRVLSPETRPADRLTASAPSPVTPASQPAARP